MKVTDTLQAKTPVVTLLRKHRMSYLLTGAKDSPHVDFIEFRIIKDGKQTYHSSWITDIELTEANVRRLVRAARARWKIENQRFNTLKNPGYRLEYNYGHGTNHLSSALFLLNLPAFCAHQILKLTDGLYSATVGGSRQRRRHSYRAYAQVHPSIV